MAITHKSLFHGSNKVYTQLHIRPLTGNLVRVQVPTGEGTMSDEYNFEVNGDFIAAVKKALNEGTPAVTAEPTTPVEERLDSMESRIESVEGVLERLKGAL